MSDTKEEVQIALGAFVSKRQTVTVFPAQIKSVDATGLTCDVIGSDDIEYYEVRLRATVDGNDDGFVLIPAVDSWVLIGNIGNSSDEYVVLATSNTDKASFKIDNAPG